MQLEVSWLELKTFLDNRQIASQYVEFDGAYIISGIDGQFSLFHKMMKVQNPDVDSDQYDFEQSYKLSGNKVLNPTDSDNSPLTRGKITNAGWNYQVHTLEWSTSTDEIKSYDEFMQDLGFGTITFYQDHARQNQITENLTDATNGAKVTVVDWMPTFDYEILGGFMKQITQPASPVYFFATGIPDVPEPYRTDLNLFPKKFTNGGINIEFLADNDKIELDGKAPKMLPYTPGLNTNKMRLVVVHDPGVQHRLQLSFFIFVP